MHFFKLILRHIKPALDSVQLQKKTSVVTTKFYKLNLHYV